MINPNLHFTVLSVFLIFFCQSYGQEIAEKQCEKYITEFEKIQTQKTTPKLDRRLKRIAGGTKSTPTEFPFMAALGFGGDDNRQWLYGGSLISEKFVLTAAHSVSYRHSWTFKLVRLGTTDITVPAQDIAVKKIHVHPQYLPPSAYNDIALVELENMVNFTSSVFPACLQTDSRPIDVPVIAIGWGKTDFAGDQSKDLLKVILSINSYEQCRKTYSSVPGKKLSKGIQNDTQICAGAADNTTKNTCSGDSGGPLLLQSGNRHSIVGITSLGEACGIANTSAVYTRVSAFVPWLESIVWK